MVRVAIFSLRWIEPCLRGPAECPWRFRLQVRAESFNLTNHPNFGLPNSAIGNPSVGIITTTINRERQNQLALKLYF